MIMLMPNFLSPDVAGIASLSGKLGFRDCRRKHASVLLPLTHLRKIALSPDFLGQE